MRVMRTLRVGFLSAALALSMLATTLQTSAQATTMREQSLAQLGKSAERIVIGRVLKVQTRIVKAKGLSVQTDVEVEVERLVRGAALPERFTLNQLGGTAGEGKGRYTQTIVGYPEWREGERVVLFLERTDTGRLVTSGLAMGKYVLTTDADGVEMAQRSAQGLHRLGRKYPPQRTLLGAPSSDEHLPLSQLLELASGQRPSPVLRQTFSSSKTPTPPATIRRLGAK